jgi:hypothetical protein
MLKTRNFFFAAAVALMMAVPTVALADDAVPSLSEMWTMTIKTDHRADFFKGLKAHMAFRTEAGDPRVWKTYTPMLGDEVGMVAVRYCCLNWADVDAYREWSENHPEVGENWEQNVAPHVESYGHYFDRIQWEQSNVKGDWSQFRYFGATDFTPMAGRGGEFDAARIEISQIALNHGWATEDHPWIWSTNIGGSPSETLVIPYKKLADMDQDDDSFFNFLAEVKGSEEAADELFSGLTDNTASQSFQIWELHEDLSMQKPD